ncbi:MAG: I78 family peptidase inhibitor [Alphaproteobacteria bacterium]
MKKLYLIALPFLLTGCAEIFSQPTTSNAPAPSTRHTATNQTVTTQSLDGEAGEVAAPQDGACPSGQYSSLIGQKFQDIPSSNLPPYFRTLKPGQNLVMSQPLRVNLYLDRAGKVTTVRCG